MRVKLVLEYEGTEFAGWQLQPGHRTVQGALESCLQQLTGQTVRVEGAGRTDAGAHALGQVASFVLDTAIPIGRLAIAMNSLLPTDVVVLSAEGVRPDFHPRHSATSKLYRYLLRCGDTRSALERNRAWQVDGDFLVERAAAVLPLFVGTHDFKAFCASGSSVATTVRTIYDAGLVIRNDLLAIEFCGNGFLYKMVRNMVGSIVAVGRGRAQAQDVSTALASGRRPLAFTTAPAHGLYLVEVKYDANPTVSMDSEYVTPKRVYRDNENVTPSVNDAPFHGGKNGDTGSAAALDLAGCSEHERGA